MNFNLFAFIFVFAWLAQLYTSDEKTELELKNDDTTPQMKDYKSLQAFKYFVYPIKYSNSMFNNSVASRNITLDKINYQPVEKASSIADKETLFRIIDDDQPDYRQNIPNNYYNGYDGYVQPQQGFQPHFFNQGNSMVHLVDPLFLMATLAFVVFLINSILGLVNKLNLPILGSTRNQALNEIDDEIGERDRMNDEVLDEIERIIKNALAEFQKHLD